MAAVEFNTYKTNELSAIQLKSLVKNFNSVFEKDFPIANFEQQYNITLKGFSYHSLMEQNGEVVGACSAVPYEYIYNGEKRIFGLLVGLFIVKEFRKDPYALYKVYSKLKDLLIEDHVSVAFAVPNHNSYPYFKHVLKWKDIGTLPYYVLPVNYGNIKKSAKWYNAASRLFAHTSSSVNTIKSVISNNIESLKKIHIVKSEPLMVQHRYHEAHKIVKKKNFSLFYRADIEEEISTIYIIDFYNNSSQKDTKSLAASIRYILKNESPDIIIYVGSLNFKQYSLIKVPESKEPRKLNFCCEILIKNDVADDILEMSNWDFGLYNFDVR